MSERVASLLTVAVVAALIALPRVAHACPSCAGREDGGYVRFAVLAAMILFPFGIAYIVYRVLRDVNVQSSAPELGRLGQTSQEK